MNNLINNQINLLIIFTITGLSIGLLFDFFRAQRKFFRTKDFITNIEDIIFWICSAIIIIYVVLKYTNGEFRLYMLFGILTGLIFYFLLISKIYIKLNLIALKYISAIIKIFLFPIKKLFNFIKKAGKRIIL